MKSNLADRRLRQLARNLRNRPTEPEFWLWRQLRRQQLAGARFRRQQPLGGYIVDFVCPALRLIIEIDGSQHVAAADADRTRTQQLESLGYRVLRFWNPEVMEQRLAVLEAIARAIEERRAELIGGRGMAPTTPLRE